MEGYTTCELIIKPGYLKTGIKVLRLFSIGEHSVLQFFYLIFYCNVVSYVEFKY